MAAITKIYQHPDGHEIAVGNNLLTVCTDEGESISIPLGIDSCTMLGKELLALGAAQNESEQAGADLGAGLVQVLTDIRAAHQGQDAAFCAVRHALLKVADMEHPEHAFGGFAGQVVNVLELGIANLPKAEVQ